MFCTSLRRRPSFVSAISTLTSPSLALRESQLTTHDLCIPFNSVFVNSEHSSSNRQLRILLLSPSSTSETKLEDSFLRIQHFASLTGGQDIVIVFLLNTPPATSFRSVKDLVEGITDRNAEIEALHSYTRLQAEMFNHTEVPHVPILPLRSIDGLPDLLKKHVKSLARTARPSKQQTAPSSPLELLQLCSANPPLSEHSAYILSDLFASLPELATACNSVTSAPNSSSPSTRAAGLSSQTNDLYDLGLGTTITKNSGGSNVSKLKQLRDLVGEQECRDIVDFWKEEWTVD